jgi:hypothetical protein
MHIPSGKNDAEFQQEFERILDEAGTGDADFTGFVFPSANYSKREFKARCVFSRATFTQDANFSDATFTQNADFSDATFTRGAFFLDSRFSDNANFSSVVFKHWANFSDARFSRDAFFQSSTFEGKAYFSTASFRQAAHFYAAWFKLDAQFSGTTFEQDADFRDATFEQNADFSWAKLKQAAYFSRAKFLGAASFRETDFRRDENLLPGPVFSLTEFFRAEAIVFYKTYLGQALFHNCDVSESTFSSVEWRIRKDGGKRMVFEEVAILDDGTTAALKSRAGNGDERDYGLIAELYQQLKKNYDERKDYWTAGDFHYGEMEMKRLHSHGGNQARWLHRNFGLVAWYKYANAYGESYVRPVALLLIALAIFTLLFPWAGLDRNENPPNSGAVLSAQQTPREATTSELSYRHLPDFVGTYHGRKWVAAAAFFGHSLMTTLSVAGFQKELKYEPSYPWGRALALLEVLLTSTLAALFLLAIRRQFRR